MKHFDRGVAAAALACWDADPGTLVHPAPRGTRSTASSGTASPSSSVSPIPAIGRPSTIMRRWRTSTAWSGGRQVAMSRRGPRTSPKRAAARPRTAGLTRARTTRRPSRSVHGSGEHHPHPLERRRGARARHPAPGDGPRRVGAWDTSGQHLLRELRARAPAAILIDLTRLPAQGPGRRSRDPDAQGDARRADRVRRRRAQEGRCDPALLPDASFTTMSRVSAVVKRALGARRRPARAGVDLRCLRGRPLAARARARRRHARDVDRGAARFSPRRSRPNRRRSSWRRLARAAVRFMTAVDARTS